MKRPGRECTGFRRRLQTCLDDGSPLPLEVGDHLAVCADCRRLIDAFSRFRTDLARAANELSSRAEPEWEAIFASAQPRTGRAKPRRGDPWWRRPPLLVAAAATVCLLSFGGIFGYRELAFRSAQRFVREDTARFVDAMLASPIDQVGGSAVDWVGGPVGGGPPATSKTTE